MSKLRLLLWFLLFSHLNNSFMNELLVESPGIILILETADEVVTVPDHVGLPSAILAHNQVEPEVEGVVQVGISKYWGHDSPHAIDNFLAYA